MRTIVIGLNPGLRVAKVKPNDTYEDVLNRYDLSANEVKLESGEIKKINSVVGNEVKIFQIIKE